MDETDRRTGEKRYPCIAGELQGWLMTCCLNYHVTGKAVQKICDSYRISDEWKGRFRALRPMLKEK